MNNAVYLRQNSAATYRHVINLAYTINEVRPPDHKLTHDLKDRLITRSYTSYCERLSCSHNGELIRWKMSLQMHIYK